MLPAIATLPAALGAAASGGGISGIGSSLLGASGISALTSIAGGLFSNSANRSAQERAAQENREVLQNAVSWRVADARRAGIHPLYALGAQVATSGGQPQFIGDQLGPSLQSAGQDISTAVARSQSGDQQLKNQLDLALMRSNINESDARTQFIQAQQRALEQTSNGSPAGMGLQQEQVIPGQSPNVPGVGIIDLKAQEQTSAKAGYPDTVAGKHPWFQENQYGGQPFLTPAGKGEHPEELLSEMSLGAYIGLLRQNQARFGGKWFRNFMGYRYGGYQPHQMESLIPRSDLPSSALKGAGDAIMREINKYRGEKQRYPNSWKERRK